ncbi:MAG: stage II sporulation protein P [Clostridia bacterium]|nr:stage II sporulation protein P [Clostridia bacterium]
MEENKLQNQLPSAEHAPTVSLASPKNSHLRFFAVFLICCAILIAAFAASAALIQGDGGKGMEGLWSLFKAPATSGSKDDVTEAPNSENPPPPKPAEGILIFSRDLSYPELGTSYIHNETIYTPNVSELLNRELLGLSQSDSPQVLILHSHTRESYLTEKRDHLDGAPGDATYSDDPNENMIAVGKALADTLKQKGITAIHCTVMHDTPTLGGAYERSAETVRNYLKEYPSISYVIDLHRDAILTSEGEYIRTESSDPNTAQVMAVVGSDCNGTRHSQWEENLALALQLREALNQRLPGLCRPISLRNASYNQELAPRFLLLEIGSGANTAEEAENAARLVGETLADLLQAR